MPALQKNECFESCLGAITILSIDGDHVVNLMIVKGIDIIKQEISLLVIDKSFYDFEN